MRLPGFDVLRVPGRFVMTATICHAVLASIAIATWARASRRALVVALVALGLVADGWVRLPIAAAPADGVGTWSGVSAILELPLGDQQADFGAMFRGMSHQLPIVNGVSGYVPPHYLPLAQSLRHEQFGALFPLSSRGPIGVAVDRMRADADRLSSALVAAGLEQSTVDDRWRTFVVPKRAMTTMSVGAQLAIVAITASTHEADARRMLDNDVRTGWGSGNSQVGTEQLVADLGADRSIGSVVLDMGAYSFGYPSTLEIDGSRDRQVWTPLWRGESGPLVVRAAIESPGQVPVTFYVQAAETRYVRLRQTGEEPGLPWWVAELRVHAP
jgi:hypothetical protein